MWLAGFLLAVLAALGVAWPWLTHLPQAVMSRRRANAAAFSTRLAELEAEAAAGVLAPEALERARGELAARAAGEAAGEPVAAAETVTRPWVLAAVAGALLAFGGAWYGLDGSWRIQQLVQLAEIDPEAAQKAGLENMVAQLQAHVASQPDDAESWTWLGRGLSRLGRFEESAKAFRVALQLKGGHDVDLMVEQGGALAHSDPQAAANQFDAVLAVVPDDARALWYAGALAMQRGDAKAALGHWDRLLQQDLPPSVRTSVEHAVAELSKQTGVKLPAHAAPAPARLKLDIEVSLAPELSARLKPGDTLFVFAQAAGGPPMPLAVQKLAAAGFPVATSLDDSNSPMPTRKLSSVDRWHLVARVSGSGAAQPQAGDLQGEIDVAKADAQHVLKLRIDRVLP